MEGNQTGKDLSDMSIKPRTAVTDSQQCLPTARKEAWEQGHPGSPVCSPHCPPGLGHKGFLQLKSQICGTFYSTRNKPRVGVGDSKETSTELPSPWLHGGTGWACAPNELMKAGRAETMALAQHFPTTCLPPLQAPLLKLPQED